MIRSTSNLFDAKQPATVAQSAVSPLVRYLAPLALALLCLMLFFWRLGSVPLFDLDEGLYVTCAREMARSGNWVTPHLNSRPFYDFGATTVPFFEKPILIYWLAAAAMRCFGISVWAARLPVAMAALLTTLAVALAGTRWFGRRAGLLAGLVYATAPITVVDARQLTTDGLLVLWFTAALLAFWRCHRAREHPASTPRSIRYVLLFWTLCAFAVLTKGAVGLLLPGLVIGIYLLLDRLVLSVRRGRWGGPKLQFVLRLHPVRRWWPSVQALRPLAGLLWFVALILPWHLLVWRAGGRDELGHTWVQEYLLIQHIGRFKGVDAVHNAPLPSYLLFYLIGFFPWACFSPAAFRKAEGEKGRRGERETTASSSAQNLPSSVSQDASGGSDHIVPVSPSPLLPFSPSAISSSLSEKAESEVYRYLLVWFWTIFIFFSLAAAKLPTYIAPAYPAAALLTGRWLDRVLSRNAPIRSALSLQRGALAATLTGVFLVIAALIGPLFAPADAPIPADVVRLALHITLLLAVGSGLAWGCFRLGSKKAEGERGRRGVGEKKPSSNIPSSPLSTNPDVIGGSGSIVPLSPSPPLPFSPTSAAWGVATLAAMLVCVVGVGCTEGYAVAARDILGPYQQIAIDARSDAARGIPIIFYNIIPRRPSMLYYARDYSPYEHKETPLLPFVRRYVPLSTGQVDVITSRDTYDHQLQSELAAAPDISATLAEEHGHSHGGWVLVRLQF